MSGAAVIRLHLFFARDNDRAVILRQGPSRQFRMILWHRDSDRFEDGQWLKHKVYVERCDLSPDGRHFLYFALNGDWRGESKGAYTAISRPPWFSALALFPQGDTWGGGGRFLDSRHYVADGGADIIGRDDGLARVRLGIPDRGCATGIRLTDGRRAPLDRALTRRLLAAPAPNGVRAMLQRAAAPDGGLRDRYDTLGGRLYRRRGQDLELIRDFTGMRFEPVRGPHDRRQEPDLGAAPVARGPWHPLDGEGR